MPQIPKGHSLLQRFVESWLCSWCSFQGFRAEGCGTGMFYAGQGCALEEAKFSKTEYKIIEIPSQGDPHEGQLQGSSDEEIHSFHGDASKGQHRFVSNIDPWG